MSAPCEGPSKRRRAERDGAVAQLGERLVRNEEVRGSIPLSSTISQNIINHSNRLTVGLTIVTARV